MSEPTFATGDLVVFDPQLARPTERGIVYRVADVLKVNLVVEPIDGGRRLRAHPSMFKAAPTDTTTAAAPIGVPDVAPLWPATVITVAGPGWTQPPEQLYVVLRDTGNGTVSFVKLGGNEGRYWRGVRRGLITVIDPTRINLKPPTT
jgi:hypothetical protein